MISIRKIKRHAQCLVFSGRGPEWHYNRIVAKAFELTPEEKAARQKRLDDMWTDVTSKMKKADLVEGESGVGHTYTAPAEGAVVLKYTVARKKDGEIVGEFESLTEAEDVIAKAKKAKKATLVLV